MAVTPQKEFDVTLPTHDTATPPNPLVNGEVTSITIEVTPLNGTKTTYVADPSSLAGVGTVQQCLFTGLTPPFVPVAGTTYSADAFVTDDTGNSTNSPTVTWTQLAASAVPAAPGLAVS